MKKVLVTGATGFIGRNLIERLMDLNYEIYVLSRKKSENNFNGSRIKKIIYWEEIEEDDFFKLNYDELNKIDYCIHLAAYGVSSKENNIQKMIDGNIKIFSKLLKFCNSFQIKKIINTGSGFEYGDKGRIKITEEEKLEPFSLYGASKASTLMFGRIIASNYNIKMVTLRFFNIFGVGESKNRLIPYVIENVVRRKETKLTPGMQERDYLYIKDVIEAYAVVLEKDLFDNEIYNVCSGIGISLKELIYKVVKVINPVETKLGFGVMPYRVGEAMYIVGDGTKFKNKTGWEPKYSIEEGIKEMYNDYIKGEINEKI